MSIALKWANDTNDVGAPIGDIYFRVPQVLNITGGRNIECGSWFVLEFGVLLRIRHSTLLVFPRSTTVAPTSTVGPATSTTSRPSAASPAFTGIFALVQAALAVALALLYV
jgi:hypothetical protein